MGRGAPDHDGGFGIRRRRRVRIVGLRLRPGERLGPGRWRSPRPSTCALKGPVICPWPPQTPHSKIPRRPEPPHPWHVRGPLMTAPAGERRAGTASSSNLRAGTPRPEHRENCGSQDSVGDPCRMPEPRRALRVARPRTRRSRRDFAVRPRCQVADRRWRRTDATDRNRRCPDRCVKKSRPESHSPRSGNSRTRRRAPEAPSATARHCGPRGGSGHVHRGAGDAGIGSPARGATKARAVNGGGAAGRVRPAPRPQAPRCARGLPSGRVRRPRGPVPLPCGHGLLPSGRTQSPRG